MNINTNESSIERSHTKGKKRRRRRFLLLFILVFLGAGAGYAGYVGYHAVKAVDKSYVKIKGRGDKSDLRQAPVYVSSDPFSVLLLGIEDYSSNGDHGRSDTMMLATFNPKEQTMKLLSIPRDTLIQIPGKTKKNKINAAYAYGGKELSIKTVEQFLGIPIDYYVTVNFDGFKNIVDLVNGVTVDVPFDFNDINPNWQRFYFHKGEEKLNGEAALVYARMRKQDPRGDFGRNDRQRQIVAALVDKLSTPEAILKLGQISDAIGNNIETNMKVSEALAFRQKYSSFNSSDIQQLQIKGTDDWIKGIYYFKPDPKSLEEDINILKTHLAIEKNQEPSGSNSAENKQVGNNG